MKTQQDKSLILERALFHADKPDSYVLTGCELMHKYGIPGETKMGKYTHKVINLHLDAFKEMYDVVEQACDFLEINGRQALNAICEYAKNGNYIDMNNITKKLSNLLKLWQNGSNENQANFINVIKDIDTESRDPKFNHYDIVNIFHARLAVNKYSVRYKNNKGSYTLSDNSNPMLEDNNN